MDHRGRVLGVSHDSPEVIPDGTDFPAVANSVIDYVPTARPGSHAPHLWLWQDGQAISTLDLYDTQFVLLTGRSGQLWKAAGERAGQQLGIPVRCYLIGPEGDLINQGDEWPRLYGVQPDGAVLVRPDGHVAWRTQTAGTNPNRELVSVLRHICGSTMQGRC